MSWSTSYLFISAFLQLKIHLHILCVKVLILQIWIFVYPYHFCALFWCCTTNRMSNLPVSTLIWNDSQAVASWLCFVLSSVQYRYDLLKSSGYTERRTCRYPHFIYSTEGLLALHNIRDNLGYIRWLLVKLAKSFKNDQS